MRLAVAAALGAILGAVAAPVGALAVAQHYYSTMLAAVL